ncbi:cytidine deaminase [Polyangium sorediatum]|uniref:Cytidine deaminase n=1 Tax=Polyangium sorediatum TaxID=889274 RepID=A0ABT6P7M3_9BACT|nr:cytidine deaminase [Polyangium sorediatum]MDI1436561.1 cytidine deaminase [Polyangium sorediatum]
MTDLQTTIDWAALERAALDVQTRAHAPYSAYQVGAAVLTASGRIFTGCNVENASYGLSICAERSAIVQMVAAGERAPIALTVVTPGTSKLGPGVESPAIGAPCGMCRQTLAEFAEDLPIRMAVADRDGLSRMTSLAALLPEAFRAKSS